MVPSDELMSNFRLRADNQILGLELLSISLALSTFRPWLAGRRIIIHSDNTGAEVCIRKGSAKRYDHAQLVHDQWLDIAKMGAS
eukprot:6242044-Karenia_brevis.AAC.1